MNTKLFSKGKIYIPVYLKIILSCSNRSNTLKYKYDRGVKLVVVMVLCMCVPVTVKICNNSRLTLSVLVLHFFLVALEVPKIIKPFNI